MQSEHRTFGISKDWQAKIRFSAKDLTDLFLNATAHWYREKGNALYGKRAAVRKVLMAFLVRDTDITQSKEEIYALNKFQAEWLPDIGFAGQNPMFLR